MNRKEIAQAKKMLADYVDRFDTIINDDGQSLTAYWIGGGQTMFHTLEFVKVKAKHCPCANQRTE